jgi:hypothetical protein
MIFEANSGRQGNLGYAIITISHLRAHNTSYTCYAAAEEEDEISFGKAPMDCALYLLTLLPRALSPCSITLSLI